MFPANCIESLPSGERLSPIGTEMSKKQSSSKDFDIALSAVETALLTTHEVQMLLGNASGRLPLGQRFGSEQLTGLRIAAKLARYRLFRKFLNTRHRQVPAGQSRSRPQHDGSTERWGQIRNGAASSFARGGAAMVGLLLGFGCSVYSRDTFWNTPLHYVAAQGKGNAAGRLLEVECGSELY